MLILALQTIRTYPTRFIGTFVALTLGIALIAASGLVIAAPGPEADVQAATETASLLVLMAGISGFSAIFVVAGTCALAIQQRRRELALMRIVGATPRQTRRMLASEVRLVWLAAAVTGCALALPAAHAALAFLRWLDVITPAATIVLQPGPLAVAAGVGLVVAQLGVRVASRRALRIRPVEALRHAAVEQKPMTISRWVIGVLATAAGVAMLGAMTGTASDNRLACSVPW